MTKRTILLAMIVMAMVSCSQDETISVKSEKGISFRTMSNAGTRATETTTSTLNEFNVTALDRAGEVYFKDIKFSKNETEFTQSGANSSYPWIEGEITFHAYSPTNLNNKGTFSWQKTEGKLTGFTVEDNVQNQVDLIYATAKGSRDNDEQNGVALKFQHLLSQIEIKAKNDNEAYTVEVKGVKIANVKSTGNIEFYNTTSSKQGATQLNWTQVEKPQTYTNETGVNVTLNGIAASIMGSNGNWMLMPQTLTVWEKPAQSSLLAEEEEGTYIAIKVKVTMVTTNYVAINEEYVMTPISTSSWEMGKKYIYTLDFSKGIGIKEDDKDNPDVKPILGGPIKFTAMVTGWEDDSNKVEETVEMSGEKSE